MIRLGPFATCAHSPDTTQTQSQEMNFSIETLPEKGGKTPTRIVWVLVPAQTAEACPLPDLQPHYNAIIIK